MSDRPHVRILGREDATVLTRVAPGVFDEAVDPRWSAEFLADARHHLAVAIDDGEVVGMASGVRYVHPDKPPGLWVNEVGVADSHQGKGIGKRLLAALFERARELGCGEAWVLTERTNEGANGLYRAAGGRETEDRPVMFEFDLGSDPQPSEAP